MMPQFNTNGCPDTSVHTLTSQRADSITIGKEKNDSINAIHAEAILENNDQQKNPRRRSFSLFKSEVHPLLTKSASTIKLNSDPELPTVFSSMSTKVLNPHELENSANITSRFNPEIYLQTRPQENLYSINSNTLLADQARSPYHTQDSNDTSALFYASEGVDWLDLKVNQLTEYNRMERISSPNNVPLDTDNGTMNYNTTESHTAENTYLLRTNISGVILHRKMSNSSNIDIIYRVNSFGSSYQSSSESRVGIDDTPTYPKSSMRAEVRKLIIEELISFEETYISNLKILVNFYFGTVDTCGDEVIRTVSVLKKNAESLIEYHQDLLNNIRLAYPSAKIFKHGSSNENDFHNGDTWSSLKDINTTNENGPITSDCHWSKPILTASSPSVAETISGIVANKAIIGAVYEQYCLNYDTIMNLLKMFSGSKKYLERTWSKGSENIVNATRSKFKHTDLSLDSLAITPIARISKYKLLLKSLLDNTTVDDDLNAHESIAQSLNKVEKQLSALNSYGSVGVREKSQYLWHRLVFEKEEPFRAQCLGNPILCGALSTTWIEKYGVVKHMYMGCFLFKSYLLLADVGCCQKYLTQFMVPLTCAKLIDGTYSEYNGSMICEYNHSFKLRFEHKFGLCELLLTTTSQKEMTFWKEMIELQIVLNGDYNWDFSCSANSHENTGQSAIIPTNACIMTGLDESAKPKDSRKNYSSTPRNNILGSFRRNQLPPDSNGSSDNIKYTIYINHFSNLSEEGELPKLETQSSESEKEKRRKENDIISKISKKRRQDDGLGKSEMPYRKFVINIRRSARVKIEKILEFVWSFPDLPLIRQNFIETEGFAKKLARHTTYLKSTLSNGSTSRGSFKSVINSQGASSHKILDGAATWSHDIRDSSEQIRDHCETFDTNCHDIRKALGRDNLLINEIEPAFDFHHVKMESFNITKELYDNAPQGGPFNTDDVAAREASNEAVDHVDVPFVLGSEKNNITSLTCQTFKVSSVKETNSYGTIMNCVSKMADKLCRKKKKV